jgi:hypothetical protein
MSPTRLIAVVLIVAGALALAYQGFSYTRHHDVDVGFFDLQYSDRETVHIPAWIGLTVLGVGVALLLTRRGRTA